jgi:hypothetical protein
VASRLSDLSRWHRGVLFRAVFSRAESLGIHRGFVF